MSEARKIGKIAREAQKLNAMVFKETNLGSSELELIHYVRHHPGTTQQEATNELHAEKGAVTMKNELRYPANLFVGGIGSI